MTPGEAARRGAASRRTIVLLLALGLTATLPPTAAAQDTLRLADLRAEAALHDPRSARTELERRATGLELSNLSAGYLPQLSVVAEATHQSDVPTAPFAGPAGGIMVPKDQYRAELHADQLLWDGGRISARRGLERARLGEAEATVATDLYGVRQEVDGSFFRALLLQQRIAEVDRLVQDLSGRLSELRSRVRNGAALPGDTAALQAEILQAGQRREELAAGRRAALGVLSRLTGRDIAPDRVLALPDLEGEVDRERGREATLRSRPEFALLASRRRVLDHRADLAATERLPKLVAFGAAGYGRPGLDLLGNRFDSYWKAGIRLEWAPWHWGSVSREEERLDLRRRIVDTEEEALSRRLERSVREPLEEMERLRGALASDGRIIELREQVEREASSQLREGVITPARYIDVSTDLYDARDAWQTHRVQLAEARARYLSTLGVEPGNSDRRVP